MKRPVKPIILKEGSYKRKDVESLKKNYRIWEVRDLYKKKVEELFEILNPRMIFSDHFEEKKKKYINNRCGSITTRGDWIYYPWNGILAHSVGEKDYFTLRTNRNRNLITIEEQETLKNAAIGIVGLSIGSYYAYNLVHQGIGGLLKMAELDTIDATNLNRIRSPLYEVGKPKIDIVSQQIYELDPYWDLVLFDKGLSKNNISDFLSGVRSLDIIFEAIDDLKMKILLRMSARKRKIPVVMFTNLGDSVMIDIERYDLNPELQIFNGIIGEVPELILKNKISRNNINKYVTKLVGKKNTPVKALESLDLMGKELVGRPQLAGTVKVSGGLAPYIARKIILEEEIPSGRYIIEFDSIFVNK